MRNSVSVLDFGADPSGRTESSNAIDAAIAAAKARGKKVFIPAGTYQVNRHIVVDDVTIEGAGNWWTIIRGRQVTLPSPLPDGSVHTGVGFYGKYVDDRGGSHDVHLSNFAIEGDVRDRVDTDQVNGVGGALSDSSINGLYIHHTKVGLWFDGPMDDLTVRNTIVADVIGDGVNFRRGVTNSKVVNSFFRNTGDDAMAMLARQRDAGRAGGGRERRQRLRPQHGADAYARERHRNLRRSGQGSRTTSSPTRSARGVASTPASASTARRSPATSSSPTTRPSAPEPAS